MAIKITFLENLRTFKKGEIILLDKPNTLLVGDNGCGKSTLLQLIFLKLGKESFEKEVYPNGRWEYNSISKDLNKVSIETDYERVYVCDSILRIRESIKHIQESIIDFEIGLSANNASHGQATKYMYIKTTDAIIERREEENFSGGKALLLMDEVDVGMSLRTQMKMPNSLQNVARDGKFDVLTITHNYFIISDSRYNCYDVENRKYVSNEKYLNSIQKQVKI